MGSAGFAVGVVVARARDWNPSMTRPHEKTEVQVEQISGHWYMTLVKKF